MAKKFSKYVSKNLSGKYSLELFVKVKQSVGFWIAPFKAVLNASAFKTASRKAFQKPPRATGDLIGNKIANKFTKISKNLQQNNSETVSNENHKEISKEIPNKIPKERYTYPEERKNIHNLLLI